VSEEERGLREVAIQRDKRENYLSVAHKQAGVWQQVEVVHHLLHRHKLKKKKGCYQKNIWTKTFHDWHSSKKKGEQENYRRACGDRISTSDYESSRCRTQLQLQRRMNIKKKKKI
jgi:hypothetical protein